MGGAGAGAPPPPQAQSVMRKTAEFLQRHHEDEAAVAALLSRDPVRFAFLRPDHPWHAFYVRNVSSSCREEETGRVAAATGPPPTEMHSVGEAATTPTRLSHPWMGFAAGTAQGVEASACVDAADNKPSSPDALPPATLPTERERWTMQTAARYVVLSERHGGRRLDLHAAFQRAPALLSFLLSEHAHHEVFQTYLEAYRRLYDEAAAPDGPLTSTLQRYAASAFAALSDAQEVVGAAWQRVSDAERGRRRKGRRCSRRLRIALATAASAATTTIPAPKRPRQ
ncbi:hypothetical protein CDCA_CDCA09G2795 [Cyanidium caldarium]|uniref:SURP motif domain-containing protein n=1 Tax=Cyanidium caldarium TaxID=2771 RepID=A0AAV9IXD9_CYACA|nr:hypothetical protein CDCA_CDCA09G2795 [Cyanidium caldarium]|eukprot:ctg_393.g200